MLTFADELKQSVMHTWQEILNHRFIVEIYNDILPTDKFIFYLIQDQIFLEEFCRILNVAKRKSDNNVSLVKFFDDLLYCTINFEMKMQEQIIVDCLNVLPALPSSSSRNYYFLPSKTTLEYIYYLKQISSNGTIYEIVSAMTPCPWTYLEIAENLSKSHRVQHNKIYKKWVQFYSSDESCRQLEELKRVLCVLANEEASDKDKEEMKKHFANACKYEFLFWDMVYHHHHPIR